MDRNFGLKNQPRLGQVIHSNGTRGYLQLWHAVRFGPDFLHRLWHRANTMWHTARRLQVPTGAAELLARRAAVLLAGGQLFASRNRTRPVVLRSSDRPRDRSRILQEKGQLHLDRPQIPACCDGNASEMGRSSTGTVVLLGTGAIPEEWNVIGRYGLGNFHSRGVTARCACCL